MKLRVPMEVLLYAEHEERIVARDMLRRAEARRIAVAMARDAALWPNGRFREVGASGHGFDCAATEHGS